MAKRSAVHRDCPHIGYCIKVHSQMLVQLFFTHYAIYLGLSRKTSRI